MESHEYQVDNIHCHHCVRNIQRELLELDGVREVEGDVESRRVSVVWEPPATGEGISELLREIGYPAS